MEWIDVKEQLPTIFVNVLLANSEGVVGEGQLNDDGIYHWMQTDGYGERIGAGIVTHWAPLPPPPNFPEGE